MDRTDLNPGIRRLFDRIALQVRVPTCKAAHTPLSAETRNALVKLAGRPEIPRRHRVVKDEPLAELRPRRREAAPALEATKRGQGAPNDGRRRVGTGCTRHGQAPERLYR